MEARRLLTLGWTAGVGLPAPATELSAAVAGDGSIVLFGNGSGSAQQLSPGATSWAAAGSLSLAIKSPGASYVGVARELVVYGGYSINDGGATDLTLSFASGSTTELSPLNAGREQFAYTTDGSYAYAIGGVDANGSLLSSVEQYNPYQDYWTSLPDLPTPLAGAEAVYDGAGDIFVMGGRTAAGVSNAVYEWTGVTNAWATVASLPVAQASGGAAIGSDGKIEVIGGVGAGGNSIATVQRLDPTTGTWSIDTMLPAPRSNAAVVVDTLGRIEVIGGENLQGGVATSSATVYVTDLAPVFTSTAPVNPILVAGATYTYNASAVGPPAPTFSLVNPPAGAQVNPVTGAFAWTPTLNQTGTVTIDIRASNASNHADQVFLAAVEAPAPTALTVTGSSTSTISLSWHANVGAVAYYRVYMDGQLAAYDVVADKLTGTSATITGLASQAAGHTFYVTSFDAAGNESLFSTPVAGRTWYAGQLQYNPYYLSVPATHQLVFMLSNPTAYPPTSSYSIVSGAPAGLSLNRTTGVVTWTPTDAQALNGYFPLFSSTNPVGTVTVTAGIAVQLNYPALAVTYPGATGATAYANLAFQAQFSDGSGAPVTWKLNSAPAGVSISAGGLLRWTPTIAQALAAGTASISVTATNYAGSSTIVIAPALLTAAPPGILSYGVNKAAGTIGLSWGPPAFDGFPVSSYLVTLTYSYTTRGGGGRGGGGSHTVTATRTVTVSGSTLSTTFAGINFGGLPVGGTRYSLSVVAIDPAGDHSAAATATFTM